MKKAKKTTRSEYDMDKDEFYSHAIGSIILSIGKGDFNNTVRLFLMTAQERGSKLTKKSLMKLAKVKNESSFHEFISSRVGKKMERKLK